MYARTPFRGLGQISTLTQAIITQEGTCPTPATCQRNNPGNLMYAGQPGASGTPGSLATFDTYEDGYNALVNQLNLYANGTCGACNGQPQTISGTFSIYAPAGSGGNNPTLYASNVANALGVDPSTPLASVLAGSGGSFTSPPMTTAGFDLSSFVPDFSSIDPTTLIAGALILVFAIAMAVRR